MEASTPVLSSVLSSRLQVELSIFQGRRLYLGGKKNRLKNTFTKIRFRTASLLFPIQFLAKFRVNFKILVIQNQI